MKNKASFTLIELLVVIATMGILAAAILVTINPGKRTKQARDALRKSYVNTMANALTAYYTLHLNYPNTWNVCEASTGRYNAWCPQTAPRQPIYNYWDTDTNFGYLHNALVKNEQVLKKLPIDPKNEFNNYIWYFSFNSEQPWNNSWTYCAMTPDPCPIYWIGTFLEDPVDPAKPIFRCSNLDDGGVKKTWLYGCFKNVATKWCMG